MTPDELSYIQFEPEGGGIVLNASEEGLAFHAAAPLRQSSPIRLCVSPNPEQRIELQAEIAWMDPAKKSGGLELKEVSTDLRDKIGQWLLPSMETRMPQVDSAVPKWETVQLPAISSVAGVKTPDLLPPAVASFDISTAQADAVAITRSAIVRPSKKLFLPGVTFIGGTRFVFASTVAARFRNGIFCSHFPFGACLVAAKLPSRIRKRAHSHGREAQTDPWHQPDPSGSIPAAVSVRVLGTHQRFRLRI